MILGHGLRQPGIGSGGAHGGRHGVSNEKAQLISERGDCLRRGVGRLRGDADVERFAAVLGLRYVHRAAPPAESSLRGNRLNDGRNVNPMIDLVQSSMLA